MAASGQKPKPNSLKLVSGSRRFNAEAPEDVGELMPPPEDWSAGQKALWYEVVNAAPASVLSESDRFLVELAVRNLAEIRASVIVTAAQSAEMRRCLGEMGMTPAERGRLCAQKPAAKNPFADL